MRIHSWLLNVLCFALVAGAHGSFHGAEDQEKPQQVPAEVRALEGTYTGSWTMFGYDETNKVSKKMSWKDKLKVTDAVIKDGRAQVTTTCEMTFDGADNAIPPVVIKGTEGYFHNADGALGDYFIEIGAVQRMAKLADNIWSNAAPAEKQELMRLGFPSGAKGQHVLIKVITTERGAETHRVSRVTTVNWKDDQGQERAIQFVSLRGHHRKQK